jgi:F0F1-type ATP synthase membrane subunit c/vacuolar-type H+-ATPase subunit K
MAIRFARDAFYHLFHKRLYIALFYTIACLAFSTLGGYVHNRLGVKMSTVFWTGAVLVAPLNLLVYGLTEASKAGLRVLARSAIQRLIAKSGAVLTKERQRHIIRIALWACGAAIVLVTVIGAAAVSSFVSLIFVRESKPEHFATMFVFTFLLEVLVMVAVATVPLAALRLFSHSGRGEELAEYKSRALIFGSSLLVRVAEEQHYERVSEELVYRAAAGRTS